MMYAVVFYVTVLQLQISSAEIGSRGGRIFNNIINKNSTFNRHFKRPISRLIPLLDISREDRGEDNNAAKGKRSLETSHYAVAKPFVGRLYVVEDPELQTTLGSRYNQLLKVPLSDSFQSLVSFANNFVNDLRPIQKQFSTKGTIPKLKGFIRLLDTKLGNYGIKPGLRIPSKPPFLLVGDLIELKQIPARLVTTCELYLVQADVDTYN